MPLPTTPNPWITHHSTEVFDNPYVKLIRNEVTRPSGNPGLYTVVHFKRAAVAIIPVDDEGCTWLVGQYRYAHNRYEWEVPEGGADLDESPEACAHRELREEAGLLATTLTPILEMQLSNSVTDEISHTFVATGLSHTQAEPEETEDLTIHRLPLHEAFSMVLQGEIRDALSVASLLKLKYLLESGTLTLENTSS
jgi:8-oxo-dGTP pyrophosphatase MutT (NUDIX family)